MGSGEEPQEEYDELYESQGEELEEDEGETKKRQGLGFPKHFDEAMEHDFEVMEYHPHKHNPNYTVTVQKGDNKKKFTNIKAEHLATKLGIPPTQLK